MNITITRGPAFNFVCPVCLWPSSNQTFPVAVETARTHAEFVHGETVEVVE